MLIRSSAQSFSREVRLLDPIQLFQLCAADRGNSDAWCELLRRYSTKLRYFIHGTLRQAFGYSAHQHDSTAPGGIQESDLFQNAILRLVENNCAAMKRFSGTSENDLLAYLAVICRSSVLDTLRRSNALKRRHTAPEIDEFTLASAASRRFTDSLEFERDILVGEIVSLTQNTIECHSGDVSSRDRLVFKLHFFDGLSYSQIARCKGINLSKAGVEKLLKRLVGRVQTLASSGKSEETVQ
jgi:RNA polymerase sigma factor (sigma-70 family)